MPDIYIGARPVPVVKGYAPEIAEALADAAGFLFAYGDPKYSGTELGLVADQSPSAGTDAEAGTVIYLYLSLGANPDGATSGPRPPRRYFVEIDGQTQEVRTEAEAQALLRQTVREEVTYAKAQVQRAISKGKADLVAPDLKADGIDVGPFKAVIDEAYRKASEQAFTKLAEDAERKRRNSEADEALLELLI